MRGTFGSVVLGAAALGILDAVLSRTSATKNVGGVLVGVSKAVNWFVSPAVPAFTNASASTSSTSLAALSVQGTPSTTTVPALSFPGTTEPQSPQTVNQGGAV